MALVNLPARIQSQELEAGFPERNRGALRRAVRRIGLLGEFVEVRIEKRLEPQRTILRVARQKRGVLKSAKWRAASLSMRAVRSSSGNFSNSASVRVNSPASFRLNFGITGHGMSSTSLGSSLFNPPP